ncbi:MAG: hypothetical protein HY695_26095 [Deltaproteobacteria bacterium]|nr:hypothetical protein [Deltaproteobacteria bacterium]
MLQLLERLIAGLLSCVDTDVGSKDQGALYCASCKNHHSRAGEAAFPFVFLGAIKNDPALSQTGFQLADWLIRQQNENGSWPESPGNWTGTTVFQLMALAALVDQSASILSAERRERYRGAILKAAPWVLANSRFRRVNVNYIAAGAAALAIVNRIYPDRKWQKGARRLAQLAAGRINRDGLVEGEGMGRRIFKAILIRSNGIDIGYGLEMSLASLSLYAKITKDEEIANVLSRALEAHLFFVYPDGSLDNSLGSRGYKWTIYGSKTAHGSQMAWAFGASENPIFACAQQLTTEVLKDFIVNGLLSNGPRHCEFADRPCIYPSFTRAANLAFALSYFSTPGKIEKNLPCQKRQWVKNWPTLNSVLLRRVPWMATVSGYGESTLFATSEGTKRFKVPAGGAITYLYHDYWGPVQAATQLAYWNWEKLHVPPPPIKRVATLTPRIEFGSSNLAGISATFGACKLIATESPEAVTVSGKGALILSGSGRGEYVGNYAVTHEFQELRLTKRYQIELKKTLDMLYVIEPILLGGDQSYEVLAMGLAVVKRKNRLILSCQQHAGSPWKLMNQNDLAYCPLPALVAYPLTLSLQNGDPGLYSVEIAFEVMTTS